MTLIRVLFIIFGFLGAFGFGTWAYIFYQVMVHERVMLYEPADPVIAVEFALAVLFTWAFLVVVMVAAFRDRR